MQLLTFDQPGHGLKAHVGVRAHVRTSRGRDGGRPHVVSEAPGANGAAPPSR